MSPERCRISIARLKRIARELRLNSNGLCEPATNALRDCARILDGVAEDLTPTEKEEQ